MKIILVHGTWGRGFNPDKDAPRKVAGEPADPRWFEAGSRFCVALSSGLSGLEQATDFSAFRWSGANSIEERQNASALLAKTLDKSVAAAPETLHFIIAHSHGGNVALDARQAMSETALNVHIVTLATPFLSIYQRTPRITDRLFAICLSVGFVVSASYVSILWAISASIENAAFVLLPGITFLSVLIGAITFVSSAYQVVRKKKPSIDTHSTAINSAKRINNKSLLASGLLFCAGLLLFGFYPAAILILNLLPAIFLLFLGISKASDFLYGAPYNTPSIRQSIPNLAILRSQRDEASLALFFGKITSLLAHIAGVLSIIVPIAAVSLALLLLYSAVDFALSQLRAYRECVALGQNCFIPGEYVLQLLIATLDLSNKTFRYLAFGFLICVAFVLLAAVCKSLFGRELLYRSLNLIVDVYDTPGGSNSYSINWCARLKENPFGLRHSLYNNPDAVNKIIAYITHVFATGSSQSVDAASAQTYGASRNKTWRAATAIAVVVGTYATAVLVAYAPPGATSTLCALNAYFEPSGLKGGFTVLVARFQNDVEGVGDRLVKEIRHRYGLHVLRTCSQVTKNREDRSSAENLLSGYNSDLVLWGKVAKEGQIELQITERRPPPNANEPIVLTQVDIPEFVAKQLRSYLMHAIKDSAQEISSSEPPANLADYADRVDAFIQNTDWTDDPSEDRMEKFERRRDEIGMHAAAGRLMLAAALANKDGLRVKKAIFYFARASSIVDGMDDFKELIINDWADEYSLALLSDARLNKAEDSAKHAASMYLKKYEEAVENRVITNGQLHRYAGNAASAVSELYSITRNQDSANSAIRLACESLLRLRYWQQDRKWLEKRNAPLARRGLQQGILPKALPPEQSEAYKILMHFGKDPSIVFAPWPGMKLKDCETF
ncbi:hypothetical protein [Microvirga zambiensis]|uniref:hypothetical protein n=1 Tax=Microvirga zambiensis TaxID=1402137 RepID=UPI0019201C76|nr:hypothetical protein [Microvirga zambiensis]